MNIKQLLIFTFALLSVQPASSDGLRPVSCRYQIECGNFDVILSVGQSNATSRGVSLRFKEAMTSPTIFQLGRYAEDFEIIQAKEPLYNVIEDGLPRLFNGIGFGLSFALQYERYSLQAGREILIIPAAKGASSVLGDTAYWREGGPGEQDVNERLSSVLRPGNGNKFVAIAWHQGESDAGKDIEAYSSATFGLLTGIRSRFGNENTPIILGELTPSLINWSRPAADFNDGINRLAASIPYAGLALSDALGAIGGKENREQFDRVHFTSEAQIELGKRYFCAFERITSPNSDLARTPYCRRFSHVAEPTVVSKWLRWISNRATAGEQ